LFQEETKRRKAYKYREQVAKESSCAERSQSNASFADHAIGEKNDGNIGSYAVGLKGGNPTSDLENRKTPGDSED